MLQILSAPGRTDLRRAPWSHIVRGMREQLTRLRADNIEQALGVPQARMVLKRMADAGVLERVAAVYPGDGSGIDRPCMVAQRGVALPSTAVGPGTDGLKLCRLRIAVWRGSECAEGGQLGPTRDYEPVRRAYDQLMHTTQTVQVRSRNNIRRS